MSTIPKGSTDNYSKHTKKIDEKGNLKPHPRLAKKNSAAKKANDSPYTWANMKKVGEVISNRVKGLKKSTINTGVAIGEAIDEGRKTVDYDPEDRTKAKKRY